MQKRRIPGLQVAVVRHGKIVLLGAYGLANVQDSIPVTNKTRFTINSITKAFTGIAIMQLVEAGKVELAAPISRYLDGLPAPWQIVTVQQLLNHTSGLPSIEDTERPMSEGEEAAWEKLLTMPIESAPGERFQYNATNYLLLGRIIDKQSQQPFIQFITERQLDVVGMPLTVFGDARDVVPRSARGYYLQSKIGEVGRNKARLANGFEEFPMSLRAVGGMISTAREMALWIIALQHGRLLKTSLAPLWTPGKLNNGSSVGFSDVLNGYALGWLVATRPEHPAVAAVGGARSALFIYPDDDLAVVILTNLRGSFPEYLIDEVAGCYIPDMQASAGFGVPPSVRTLHRQLVKRGFKDAPKAVNEAKKKDATFQMPERDVNAWGYLMLAREQPKEAIEVFKLNVSLYPESANAY